MLGNLSAMWPNVPAMMIVANQCKAPLNCNLGSDLFVLLYC